MWENVILQLVTIGHVREPSMALDVEAAGCDYREEMMTCDNRRVLESQLDYQTCDYTQVAWSCIPELHSTNKHFRKHLNKFAWKSISDENGYQVEMFRFNIKTN